MTGKLYVVGVGPGDPELLTLKAVRILREVKCICVPKSREEGSSLALSIVKKAINIDGKEIIEAYFPMRKTKDSNKSQVTSNELKNKKYPEDLSLVTEPALSLSKGHSSLPLDCELDTKWQETIDAVYSRLDKGIDTAFITIGDPTIYSTFFYLHDGLLDLNPELNIEIIPGVSSINASASRAKISLSLADERIAILPANYTTDLKNALERFDTVVLMKVHKVFRNILNVLNETELLNKAVYISKVGMEDERIIKNIRDVKEEDLNYFSMVIIRK
ncbi:MAG: precorrin-2 C(20)-methyltransferase [Thermodesulfovibrionia bacterium]|nr:precorrin-2 C(20)-methyltransferase [Thermodesulfovibrionia bacterium]